LVDNIRKETFNKIDEYIWGEYWINFRYIDSCTQDITDQVTKKVKV
jgi:hypothetical protein